jgi:NMD protein affecting ribosome stability and mRNA decay
MKSMSLCEKCGLSIEPMDSFMISEDGNTYHSECLEEMKKELEEEQEKEEKS